MSTVIFDPRFYGTLLPTGKSPVLAASTAPVNLSTFLAGQSLDSVIIPNGARVLIKDQLVASENGLYTIYTGVIGRSGDGDSSYSCDMSGFTTYVQSGFANGGKMFICTSSPAVPDTDDNLWITVVPQQRDVVGLWSQPVWPAATATPACSFYAAVDAVPLVGTLFAIDIDTNTANPSTITADIINVTTNATIASSGVITGSGIIFVPFAPTNVPTRLMIALTATGIDAGTSLGAAVYGGAFVTLR